MGILNSLLRAVTWWNGATLNTQIYTARKGVKVGEELVRAPKVLGPQEEDGDGLLANRLLDVPEKR